MDTVRLCRPQKFTDWVNLYKLYLLAFPAAERKPWAMIRKMYRLGRTDIWCIVKDDRFAGLAITINSPDIILLDYFAVEKDRRGQGIGTAALKALLAHYDGKGFFLEIESTLENVPDIAMRLRRKAFYLSCGLAPMNTTATLFGVKMELLSNGCYLDYRGYKAFYREHYNAWAAEHITP